MDVLSEVLKVVRLEGALFYNAEFSAPWSVSAPPAATVAPHLAPGAGHVIIYHLLVEGRCWARLPSGESVSLGAGDLVVFPHGDPHVMGNGGPVEAWDTGKELPRILAQGLTLERMGGGGEITRLVCGYMACEPRLSGVFLSGLPALVKINIRDDRAGQWLESTIRFSVGQTDGKGAGFDAMLAKLSEVLFIEMLRRYVQALPDDQIGWLAGARDDIVGKSLALMHRKPGAPWTIATLAKQVGTSRSVLAERFHHYLGEPPMAYLTRWRLQLGAQILGTSSCSVAEIADEVGYESEAAFNRAFKRAFGTPPARFRQHARLSASRGRIAAPTAARDG